MSTRDIKAAARDRAIVKYGFYKHLAIYVIVNVMLIAINLATAPESLWFIWPLLGWGVAVGLHALKVFGPKPRDVIVDRLTERELQNEARARQ